MTKYDRAYQILLHLSAQSSVICHFYVLALEHLPLYEISPA